MKTRTMAALTAGGAALVLALGAGPAMAYCSKPVTPYCADDGNLSDRHISRSKCRASVEQHIIRLGRYRTCLAEELRETDAELERFRKLISHNGGQPGE